MKPIPHPSVFDETHFIKKPPAKERAIQVRPITPVKNNRIFSKASHSTKPHTKIEMFSEAIGEPFQVLHFIGSGSFGDVYKIRDKLTNQLYAAKWTNKPHRGQADRHAAMLELFTFAYIHPHPHIVGFHKAWEQDGHMFTLTELCEGGDLMNHIETRDFLEESELWTILVDITLAIKQLQDQQVIHLDVKPDNIFRMDNGHFKLGDFGLSHITDWTRSSAVGDSRYLAPEILKHPPTTAADIFSLGATLFEASERVEMPTNGSLWHRLRENPPALEGRSEAFTNIVHRMLASDPISRPTPDEILQLPQVSQILRTRGWPQIRISTVIFRRLSHIVSLFWRLFYNLSQHDSHRTKSAQTNNLMALPSYLIPPDPRIFEAKTAQLTSLIAVLTTHEELQLQAKPYLDDGGLWRQLDSLSPPTDETEDRRFVSPAFITTPHHSNGMTVNVDQTTPQNPLLSPSTPLGSHSIPSLPPALCSILSPISVRATSSHLSSQSPLSSPTGLSPYSSFRTPSLHPNLPPRVYSHTTPSPHLLGSVPDDSPSRLTNHPSFVLVGRGPFTPRGSPGLFGTTSPSLPQLSFPSTSVSPMQPKASINTPIHHPMHFAHFPAEAPSMRSHSFESDSGMPSAFSFSFNSPATILQNQIAPVSRSNSHAGPFLNYPSRSPPLQAISVSSRTPTQNTTPKASAIDSLTELETDDLDQSGSRSFFVTSGDLQQELTARSKSVHHPLQSPSFAAPASEKSNLRDSISTTTTERTDGISALGRVALRSPHLLSSPPTSTRKIQRMDRHGKSVAGTSFESTETPSSLSTMCFSPETTEWDEPIVAKNSLMLPISLPRTSSAQVNANPKQSLLVNPFTSHSKRRNTSVSPTNQTQLQSAMKDPILTTHFTPKNDAPRAQTLPGPHTRQSKTPFSPAVGYGQLTLGRATDGDQDGLKETISSAITLSPTSIWRGKGIGSFAGTGRQPPVPPPPLLSRPPILKSRSNGERVAGMTLTMHTDEDEPTFVSGDDDTTFFTVISESPHLTTTVADDESFHFHHPLPSFPSPTFHNDRPPSRNQNVGETDTVLPALDILRVFSLVTQPALVSILAPLPIDTHVKLITSIFTVVSAVRLFTNSFRPRPQRDVQDGRGANGTADTSPRDTTLTSQLAGQFAALVLVSFFRDHFAGFTIQRAHSTSSSSLINTPTILAADSKRSSASFHSPLPSASLNNLESNLFLSRPATNPNTMDPVLHFDSISSGTNDERTFEIPSSPNSNPSLSLSSSFQTHTPRRRGSAPTDALSVLITTPQTLSRRQSERDFRLPTPSHHTMPSPTQAVITSSPSSRVTASGRRGGDVLEVETTFKRLTFTPIKPSQPPPHPSFFLPSPSFPMASLADQLDTFAISSRDQPLLTPYSSPVPVDSAPPLLPPSPPSPPLSFESDFYAQALDDPEAFFLRYGYPPQPLVPISLAHVAALSVILVLTD
ncbi:putative Membrane-associated tyrosine- and threonine-specific cdc2-inhibitory kinase [Blattamonas nauphoetae]|uniref:Membrane-associated tyrosine- and threonine-specific cdc2-inhibitory kinase n=1 Tax=Blattamonas nauphoetae TaxID=2049346 RepID=A0ABQ9WXN4_9EUKA|nr:putative Membrane-associated tyrosine- and threonine-specific cdc2-inhibitory kinase [Blattamonas nauphoetae]